MENQNGTIIVKNGEVKITDPEGLGRFPRIVPGKNAKVFIDGKEIKEETVLFSQNNVEIRKVEKECQKKITINFNDNFLEAYMKIDIIPGFKTEIRDINSPVNMAVIEGEIIEYIYPDITREEIMSLLEKNRVYYGLKEDVIDILVNTKETKEVLIAKGYPCICGEDAKVVPVKKEQRILSDNFNCINSFSIGEIVATKINPKPGKNGKNVMGEEIPPPPVKDVEMVAGDGIKLTDNKTKAIAVKNGMPKIREKGNQRVILIIPQYVIDGNIDKTTGNIKYEGDLIVLGGIYDYFDVKIGNNLNVNESIAGSRVTAGGDVLVRKNIFLSTIQAGLYLEQGTMQQIQKLYSNIDNLLKAIKDIIGEAHHRNNFLIQNLQIGRILRLLLNDKFKQLYPLLKAVHNKLNENDFDWNITRLAGELIAQLSGYKKILQIQNTALFEKCLIELKDLIDIQSNLKESHVYANYVQNATITASGNVIILKKGCYNSIINAGGDIIAFGQKGFIKGGKYAADGHIYVKEVGSDLSRTEFTIGKGLYINNVQGSVKVKAPRDNLMVDERSRILNIKVDEEGKIKHINRPPNLDMINKLTRYEQIPVVKEKQA